jgi:serine/threonine protein kinase
MVYHKIISAEQPRSVAAHSHAKTATEQKRTLKLFGRHGDIKPTNILWFPDRKVTNGHGILKLSDFGTTRFSDDKNKAVLDGECVPDSRPYQSPESRIPNRRLSVQCDVWSLGCVFLEFLCWYFGGRERVEAFESERSFGYESSAFFFLKVDDNSHSTSAELKPSVTKVSLTHRSPESIA